MVKNYLPPPLAVTCGCYHGGFCGWDGAVLALWVQQCYGEYGWLVKCTYVQTPHIMFARVARTEVANFVRDKEAVGEFSLRQRRLSQQ